MDQSDAQRDARYVQAAAEFGAALVRLARAYEPDADQRRDLRFSGNWSACGQ